MKFTMTTLLAALLITLLAPAAAHYNLKYPKPYNPIDCNRPECSGPCPPIWRSGRAKARNNPSNPSATWQRGQKVNIEWHRNNHEGGYFRRSLVPVKHMFDPAWHKKTAFEWGCWNQNRYQCGKNPECGTDKKGFAYRNEMTVPTVFPDGDYVFSMLWFGGLHWRRNKALFSDYYTCAYVRIRGGQLSRSHRPSFIRGKNHRKVKPGTCASTSSFAGECGGVPCDKNDVMEDVPGIFRNGRTPPQVLLGDLDKNALTTVPDAALPTEPLASEKKAEEMSKIEEKRDAQWAKEEQQAATKPSQTPSMSSSPSMSPSPSMSAAPMAASRESGASSNSAASPTPSMSPSPSMSYTPMPASNESGTNSRAASPTPEAASAKSSSSLPAKCADMASAPQKPTGSWGPRNSRVWKQKQAQWWKWQNYCKKYKICSCWN